MTERREEKEDTHRWIEPQVFVSGGTGIGARVYTADELAAMLLRFFEAKGLARLKEEDGREEWYSDWLQYQGDHGLYARLLCPKRYSTTGSGLDLLRLTRFLEVLASLSPAHGYSLQVTFLGFFAMLMGTNAAIKVEAAKLLEGGGVMAFGISEKGHGADLLATEFTLKEVEGGGYVAAGSKYYIGNANCAGMIAVLARKEELRAAGARARRAPLAMFVLRPGNGAGLKHLEKIRTLGVRAAFVGNFEVEGHAVDERDVFAEGREAWEAVFGAVTLGKFFLGFGSIGICERALAEAVEHLSSRRLFGKPAIEMGHLRRAMAQAYARLTAMKLYAYRALDYVQAATKDDRRYLLFTAVQKAKVSTQGVRVMAQLSECVGAFGFETRTFFEMALRDIQLIPNLEGSGHINLGVTAQFVWRYFREWDRSIPDVAGMGEGPAEENAYLFEATAGGFSSVRFGACANSLRRWKGVGNVRVFLRQVRAVRVLFRSAARRKELAAEGEVGLAAGEILATIAYGQLVAEKAELLTLNTEMVGIIFDLLVQDLSRAALAMAGMVQMDEVARGLLKRAVELPVTTEAEWDFVAERVGRLARVPPM